MKKTKFILGALALLLGLGSCTEDKKTVIQTPTDFVLNEPALANQYLTLTEDGTVELTCSQPNYGTALVTTYTVEAAVDASFANFKTMPGSSVSPRITFKASDLALALCQLYGVTEEDQKDDYEAKAASPVYFRVVAEVNGMENTRITSNVVSFNKVKGYFAVPVPGYIYVVGDYSADCPSWLTPDASSAAQYLPARIFESKDAIGSKIYSGTFHMHGSPWLRFYTALTGWDADSWGFQVEDNGTAFPGSDFTNNMLTLPLVKGKGAFGFPDFIEGDMTLIVNMASAQPEVTFIIE